MFVPADALRVQYARSSGPGGQNVNKLNTRAELWIELDAITGLSPGAIQRLKRLAGKRFTAQRANPSGRANRTLAGTQSPGGSRSPAAR